MTDSDRSVRHSWSLLNRRWLFVVGLTAWVLAVSGAVVYLAVSNEPATTNGVTLVSGLSAESAGAQNYDEPKVQIFKQTRDLGSMLVSEHRTAEFFLRNIGGKALEISKVRTSCPCTHAQVVLYGEAGEEKSPIFNGSDLQSWKGIVPAGGTATVLVTYQPSLRPVDGPVSTTVELGTNDPNRALIELQIHATVH